MVGGLRHGRNDGKQRHFLGRKSHGSDCANHQYFGYKDQGRMQLRGGDWGTTRGFSEIGGRHSYGFHPFTNGRKAKEGCSPFAKLWSKQAGSFVEARPRLHTEFSFLVIDPSFVFVVVVVQEPLPETKSRR